MPTGIAGLDHLLYGGLVRGNSLLIEGPPGSGKTTLAIRMIYEGVVRYDEPGLIVTFEEFPRQIYGEALAYGVDLAALERAGRLRVVWTPPSRILDGFRGKSDLVEKLVRELNVRRIAIDSITHFKRVAVAEPQLREVLGEILNYLKLSGINAFLVKELERIDDRGIAFEEYLVDASMRVHSQPRPGGENLRFVEVRKTRGQAHVSGRHPLVLGDRGVQVYPALRPADVERIFERGTPDAAGQTAAAAEPQRVSTGIAGLDRMLHGGLWSGTLTLVRGTPGTGKTAIATHFLDAGLRAGETCLLVSLGSTPGRVRSQVKSLGMDWDAALEAGQMILMHFQSVGLVHEHMVNALVESTRARRPLRLVLDSIDDVAAVLKDADAVHSFLHVLTALVESAGLTAILLEESGALAAGAEQRVDHACVASCALQLSVAEDRGVMKRFLAVRKHAGSDHAKELAEYSIDGSGVHVVERTAGAGGTGSAQLLPALGRVEELLRSALAAGELSGATAPDRTPRGSGAG
jgi:circadian clock protein KaiC